jgi:hypothetical protein
MSYTSKKLNMEKLFNISLNLVKLDKKKLSFGRFNQSLKKIPKDNEEYIGNINYSDFSIENIPNNTWFRRKDLQYISLFDLVNHFINLEDNEKEDTYTINHSKFILYIDPCEFHSGRNSGWKCFSFHKTNSNIRLSRSLNNTENLNDLYKWIGENQTTNSNENVNIFIMVLPESDEPVLFSKMKSYQKIDYLKNCMSRFIKLHDNISNFEIKYN